MFESYFIRTQFAGTEFNFGIYDTIAQAWYDTPPRPRIARLSSALKAERNIRSGWQEMDLLREKIALPGSVILDCGCHHGLTTVLMSAWVGPNGFVHAFDAVIENAFYTKQNLDLNEITNAAVHCAGISDKFGFAGMHNDSNVILDHVQPWTSKTTMTVRLSSLFETPPDAVKLDIEGFELGVIEADREFFATVPRLAIEIHSDYMPAGAPQKIAALLDRPVKVLFDDGILSDFDPVADYSRRCHFFVW